MDVRNGVNLAKQGQFEEAVSLLDQAYQSNRNAFNSWDLFFYAKSLKKVGRLKESVQLSKQLYEEAPDFQANANMLSWSLYRLYISPNRKEKVEEVIMVKTANFIVNSVKQEQYSAYERTVLTMVKYFKNKANTNQQQLLYWVSKLDPTKLSTETNTITDSEGIKRELASPLEEYYTAKIKALFEMKNYPECLTISTEAFKKISKFHYDNDIWLRSKAAIAKGELGRVEEGIRELEEIVKEKDHWSLYYEIFKLYLKLGNTAMAREKGAYAVLAQGGEYKHKKNLLIKFGYLLEEEKQHKEALMLYTFAKEVIKENGWKDMQSLNERIALIEREIGKVNKGYRNELFSFLQTIKLQTLPKGIGTILKVLPNGKAGFISGDNGQQYYFRIKNLKGKPRPGVKEHVHFYIMESFDKKKQRQSYEAIEITKV
ncbi:tetratricopeptide repeat protein [Evansella tamaricis]|uniref:Tetratricopeptide repeat protein n=1 Tax=Evansella tamaricis TaxID=2069301 RepID=A0ABS6JKL9_9BACI|nr:tetratricopeptide repeat protein [Evansella tamaricis]MBU9714093.1 tetratricopeptide repeat protein [Evansella tamaricis]